MTNLEADDIRKKAAKILNPPPPHFLDDWTHLSSEELKKHLDRLGSGVHDAFICSDHRDAVGSTILWHLKQAADLVTIFKTKTDTMED
jgi:hypothetical protein